MAKRVFFVVFAAIFFSVQFCYSQSQSGKEKMPAYKNANLPVNVRVKDLLSRMTLEEKVRQTWEQHTGGLEIVDGEIAQKDIDKLFEGYSYGTLQARFGGPIKEQAIINRDVQKYALEKTRLGIPVLPMHETLHGILATGATIYPQTIAQGATWNPELIKEMSSAIAVEGAAAGISQSLSPMLTLARDHRWGRVEECFGECPKLVAEMAIAYIKGMQGEDAEKGIEPGKMACMLKVMAGYEIPSGGINIAATSLGEREFRSLYLYPYEQAVKRAYPYSVMPSYNVVDGLPAHANHWLLTKVLRDEWGFEGYTYSDWGGVPFNHSLHKITANAKESAIVCLKAGNDLEAPGPSCYKYLVELVKDGRIDEKYVDQAAGRMLKVKFLCGLFDGVPEPVDVDKLDEKIHTAEHVALARRVAEESIILLKNEGNMLPLKKDKMKSIALIGPNADQVQFGDYSPTKSNHMGVTVLEGVKGFLAGTDVKISYAKGCGITDPDRSGFDEAVETAEQSDVAVVVVGDTSMIIGGGVGGVIGNESEQKYLATAGEGYDRTTLTIPGVQEDLVKAVVATGKPVVVVLVHGRPFAMPWLKDNAQVILDVFYPGEQGGNAVADVLFGKVNPSGKLPVTLPRSVGHLPQTYDYLPCGRGYYGVPGTVEKPGRDYVFSSPEPLWPFGFGLSYTTFAYSDLVIKNAVAGMSDKIRFSFTVKNTGSRAGKEVTQVYYNDVVSSTVTATKRLIRFKKIELGPGESRRLSFEIDPDELAIWNMDMERVVEPGAFDLMAGSSSDDIFLKSSFSLMTPVMIERDKAKFGLAYGKKAWASSELAAYPAVNVTTGSESTRWAAGQGGEQWITVDLEQPQVIDNVKLYWETAYGKEYKIQLSSDNRTWETVSHVKNNDGGLDEISFSPQKARYVRMYGIKLATRWGYSLYGISVN
ncbi:Periplasmic beta-glucosidase precursor [Anaerohalosphaera lusitana]|uniref:Periplasmic beta-glucosidase n=1 Tax=Anaerohalosphaera lusitana TaxID=1936003 RepID=A0A1U9NNJ8_9BACT|nr:beta-glucosidase [Anaerohalosphaera lusitana]AQT69190.1 Periplasmic beta-glucosidase precursor [Anaerohalosphaera lusitana]